jgi:hypothetical protein
MQRDLSTERRRRRSSRLRLGVPARDLGKKLAKQLAHRLGCRLLQEVGREQSRAQSRAAVGQISFGGRRAGRSRSW